MSLSPLLVATVRRAVTGASFRRCAALGLTAGTVYFIGTLYWLAQVMNLHGGLPIALAELLAVSLAVYLGLFVALFAGFVGIAVRRYGVSGVWFAPLLWVATEWLRAWLGWAFPWVLLGSSQAGVIPVVQLASVTGVYGLSALVSLVGTAVAVLATDSNRTARVRVAGVALLLVGITTWGAWRAHRGALLSEGAPMRVGLLQGNVPQEAKWDPAYRQPIMDRYIALSRQVLGEGAQLVVWPEASTPFYFDLDSAMAAPVRRLAAQSKVPFIIGTDELARTTGSADRYYNTAVLVGADGTSKASYRKIRLVPFGEYVPYKKILFFVGPLVEAVSDFTPGEDPTVFESEGTRFSVAICYEAVYAGLAQIFVARGSQLLTTITNDAWFGRSSAAFQHFDQAGLRAVEQGRYLVRAANTGFSGAVDPYGRVITKTPLFEPAAITVDVRILSGRTIYSRVGDVIAWVSLAVTAAVLLRRRRVAT